VPNTVSQFTEKRVCNVANYLKILNSDNAIPNPALSATVSTSVYFLTALTRWVMAIFER
jgi:hypothetical protein